MTISGVLLDFSGTLFRLRDAEHWLDGLPEGLGLSAAEHVALLQRLAGPFRPSTALGPEWSEHWQRRDLDPSMHHTVHLELLRRSGIPPEYAETLYQKLVSAEFWEPYPDTVDALRLLHTAGVRVAVVSNIAWDIRKVFDSNGVLDLVHEYVLSYAEGLVKPDERIFRLATERLGVPPAEALMVGDNTKADGGAAAIGARVAIVDPLPASRRQDALLDVLRANGMR